MSDQISMKDAALDYATGGWHVFPLHFAKDGHCSCGKSSCARPGKHPRWHKVDLPKGLVNATTDSAQIETWWDRWPDSNIGLRTGLESGVFVLDVDGPEGEDSLSDLIAKCGPLPESVEALTGRGRHIYFKHPGGAIPSRNGVIATALDIKGDGGYVILPPSVHYSGRSYQWELSSHPDDVPVAEPPQWLLDLARSGTGKLQHHPPEKKDVALILNGVPEGQRDDRINRYVWHLLGKGISIDEIRVLVVEAARNCVPPFPEGEALKKVDRAVAKFSHAGEADHLTDMGNARRLAALHGDHVRYCKALDWLVYDGSRWVIDDCSLLQGFAKEAVRSIYMEAARQDDEDRRKALAEHARKCESAARIQAMVQLLPSEPGISVGHEIFDRDPMLLNVANGTVDLTSGALRTHSQADFITKLAPVSYDPAATCPRWDRFICEIMDGNEDLAAFLQRAAGYTLTGETKEQVWFFCWGKGANGKGTFIDTLSAVLGDYAINTPPETFLETSGGAIRNDLARLRAARLVTASEPPAKRFDPSILKTFTGQDPITARFLHREFFEFRPPGKLFFSANLRPAVRDTSLGFWRRVILVPFTRCFEGKAKDPTLRTSLKTEASGILNWAIKGCLEWQKSGLQPPPEVLAAVREYQNETDILGDFLTGTCVITPQVSIPVKTLYEAYTAHCDETNSRRSLSKQRFNGDLLGRPGIEKKRWGPDREWTWFGVTLRSHMRGEAGGNVKQGDFGGARGARTCHQCDYETIACPKDKDQRDAKSCDCFKPYA